MVHVHDGHQRVVDDTYSAVYLGGQRLDRRELVQSMFDRTVY
jgi:hypothetical protein